VNASQLWTATSSERLKSPSDFTSQNFSADRATLKSTMLQAKNHGSTTLKVPLPDGKLAEFSLRYDSILSSDLEAENPQLATYKGTQIDQPENSGRFDYTVQGFHAMFRYKGKMVYVDPVKNKPGDYVSYYAKPSENFIDQVIGDPSYGISSVNRSSAKASTQKRTLRLAMSATGEYASKFKGTVEETKAAITTAINRVNQLYSTDLAIEFELVYFNIYTDAATDPFDNADASADLAINHDDLTKKIGDGFDIGHLFTTGGGGVARRGSVCSDSYKGYGVTGKPDPTGDSFYIDFVAHELGHQLGATHTFNGTIANCGSSNRTNATAFEPGSGSTIMAYAGICGEDDLQANSDAYFHTISIAQIRNLLDSKPACGTTTTLDNQAPVADAGKDYIVPERTPFVLTGSGTDADSGDKLTYVWEQMDAGTGNSNLEQDLGSGPLFRSRSPSSSPQRYFPRLQDLISGSLSKGETYATTNRTLSFRLTVRDGKGGVGNDGMMLTVNDSAGPFRATQPVADSVLYKTALVKWLPAGTNQAPVNCSKVDILLSDDNGANFTKVLKSGTSNDGQHVVALPEASVSDAFIMVKCSNNVFFALSERFSINPSGEDAGNIDESEESSQETSDDPSSVSGGGGGSIPLNLLIVLSAAAIIRRQLQ